MQPRLVQVNNVASVRFGLNAKHILCHFKASLPEVVARKRVDLVMRNKMLVSLTYRGYNPGCSSGACMNRHAIMCCNVFEVGVVQNVACGPPVSGL